MKVFIVSEVAFDYNDEYYYSSYNQAAIPIVAHRTLAGAEAEFVSKTVAKIKELKDDLQSYNEEWYEADAIRILRDDTPEEITTQFGYVQVDRLHELPEGDLFKIIPYIDAHFYRIDEVEIAD